MERVNHPVMFWVHVLLFLADLALVIFWKEWREKMLPMWGIIAATAVVGGLIALLPQRFWDLARRFDSGRGGILRILALLGITVGVQIALLVLAFPLAHQLPDGYRWVFGLIVIFGFALTYVLVLTVKIVVGLVLLRFRS